jgi:hypothetical protein
LVREADAAVTGSSGTAAFLLTENLKNSRARQPLGIGDGTLANRFDAFSHHPLSEIR